MSRARDGGAPRWQEVAAASSGSAEAGPAHRPGVTFLRSVAPGIVVAAVFLALGRPVAALVVALLALTISIASATSERARVGIQRVLHAVGHGVGAVLTAVLLAVVELLVVAPLSLVAWALRLDPLRYGTRSRSAAWSAPGSPSPRRPYAVDPPGPPPSRAGRVVRAVPRVVGWVAIVLVADLAVGQAVGAVTGPSELTATADLAAATADAPWFPDYLDELRSVKADFAPFVQSEERDQTGRYINLQDGVRRSYEPAAAPDDLPVVYFFGGTNLWGDGQRDEHTIPSELARLAEADGHPIRVVNLAQRGDVNQAAVLRFERAVAAASPAPDLVVFADGPDDYQVQGQSPSDDPGQYGLAEVRTAVERRDDRSLWERYTEVSVLHRVVARIQGLFSVQAAAADAGDDPDATLAADLADVYERGRQMAADIADDAGVPVRFFWLPVQGGGSAGSPYRAATEALDPSVTDLSPSLEGSGPPVYLDGVQVNERGARLLAEGMYAALRPQLEQLRPG